jgi:large subunit ribosomal protein L15
MADELSNLHPPAGSRKERMRIGRGEGSGKGKTAGRGTKGQGARGGVRRGFEGGQMPLYRRLPARGFTNIFSVQDDVVSIDAIAASFEAGEVVDLGNLVSRGLVRLARGRGVKILSGGEITHAVTVRGVKVSGAAREKILAAGGAVEEG